MPFACYKPIHTCIHSSDSQNFSINFFSLTNKTIFQNSLTHFFLSSILKEEDESSLPSPPPDPLSKVGSGRQVIPSKNNVSTMTCTNGGNNSYYANSTTTTDEESENKTHKRAHSEGSRIGHRRTPSMEGVIQLQNGG